jgi:NAD-dependent SIR2 family protein deacetylase
MKKRLFSRKARRNVSKSDPEKGEEKKKCDVSINHRTEKCSRKLKQSHLPFSFTRIPMKVKIAIAEPPEVTGPLLNDLAKYIAKSRRALVITGAGISCSSGIPVSFF